MLEIKRNTNNLTKEFVEEHSDKIIAEAKGLIPENYKYEPINIDAEINKYIEDNIKVELLKNNEVQYARQFRTFGSSIPKKDLAKFPILKQYKGQDISYIVYESVEVL